MKKAIALLLALVLVFACAACSAKQDSTSPQTPDSSNTPAADTKAPEAEAPAEETPAADDVHLTVWFSDVLGTETGLAVEDWTISKYARAFEAENPGVKIDIVYQEDQGMAQSKLTAAVSSGTAPDIVNIFGGYMVTYYKDILTDITDYIPQEDKDNLTGWEAVSENLVEGAPIYGYPEAGNELGLFIYNKALAAQAGIDLEGENAPKNAEEFKQVLKTIKDAGIQPILAKHGGANNLWTFATAAWWTQLSGTDRVVSDSMAKTKFAEDEGFLTAMDFVSSFIKEGYVNEDYSTNTDAKERFYNGEAVFYPTGNWEIPASMEVLGDNLGIYCVPSFDGKVAPVQIGGVGQAWGVVKSCEHPEIAVKFLSYLSQKDYVIEQVKASGKAPQRKDVTAEDLGWAGQSVYEKLLDYCKDVVIWTDNAMQTDVANESYTETGIAVCGNETALECAQHLDAVAEDAAG